MKNYLEERILTLYKDKKWMEIIILLEECCENNERRKFLWVVPRLSDICWIQAVIEENNLQGIISVGCGSGLLEWLIEQKTDKSCKIIGIEVDRKWWQSNYSPPTFVQNIIFADETGGKIPQLPNFALLFCYFNNGFAFCNYMHQYRGSLVLVIGPDEGQNRHTNPLPFDQKFSDLGWRLYKVRRLEKSHDCISVFVRLRKESVIN